MKIATKKLAYHLRAESIAHSTNKGQTYCSIVTQISHKTLEKKTLEKFVNEKKNYSRKLNKKDATQFPIVRSHCDDAISHHLFLQILLFPRITLTFLI